MQKRADSIVLLITVLVGMAVSSKISVMQPAQAQTTMTRRREGHAKWESHVLRGNSSLGDLQGRMNVLGEEGWEVANVLQTKDGDFVAFLKRPKS